MRNVTLALAALALLAAPEAVAQCVGTPGTDFEQVTIREINAIPQANIDQLNAASTAGTLDIGTIQTLLTNDLEGEVVEFTAAILSDPLLSGLATATNGIPGRIHVFVRDIDAIANGPAGNTLQIVDNRGDGEIQTFFVGDEIIVCGIVAPFTGSGGKSMQITPISITATGNAYGPTDPLLQPVDADISDFHREVNGRTEFDFNVYSDFNGQFVRLEGTTLVQGVAGTRPDLLYSDSPDGSQPQINQYDTSVCFRNDRDDTYFPPGQAPDCIDDDFVPPPTGTVDLQGFLIFQGDDGNFNYANPDGANFVINPMEESDFEIASAPPIVQVTGPDFIPTPADDVTVSANVVAGQGVIASVVVDYEYVRDGTVLGSGQVTATNTSGDDYEATIPALAGSNGAFVQYTVTGTDDTGNATSVDGGYLVFEGTVDSIALIQTTVDGGPGDSPLYTEANGNNNADDPIAFDLTARVQTVFQRGSSWYGVLQEDPDLAPWTGIWVFFGGDDPGLMAGDVINITEAAINERFDVTQLEDLTFTTQVIGAAPYDYKVVPTGVLTDEATAEAHEGMLVRFEDVTITDNDTGFGEWAFSSTGDAADEVEADDWADDFDDFDPATFFTNGEVREFIQGIWWFSFGEYKLAPVLLSDIGAVVTANESGIEGRTVRILGTQPNPARTTSRVVFELDQPGDAALRVFDVTGREVVTLEEGAFGVGQHAASLRASALAPGVYVVRLEANGEVATARLVVVR